MKGVRLQGAQGGGGVGGGGAGGAGGGLEEPHCAKVSTWVIAVAICVVLPCGVHRHRSELDLAGPSCGAAARQGWLMAALLHWAAVCLNT